MSGFTPFYCCYLLHSINKKQSFYIGSTPNPEKRLRQHNGSLTHGGAYRTKKFGTRPWEMVMFVYGFPNRIVALQFEHAWQHGYQTHFIVPEERVIKCKNGGRSLKYRLGVVRLLLKNQFFKRMNLKVQFFNKDTLKCWEQNDFHIEISSPLETYISVNSLEDIKSPSTASVDEILDYAQSNLEVVSKFYKQKMENFETTMAHFCDILSNGHLKCDICQQEFDYTADDPNLKPYIAFCLNYSDCKFHSHLNCLQQRYLAEEENGLETKFIPTVGKCPSCHKIMKWTDIVKYSCGIKCKYGK